MSHLKKVARDEATVWWLVLGGLGVIAVGVFLFLTLGTADAARFVTSSGDDALALRKLPMIGVVVMFIGIAMVVFGFVKGARRGFSSDRRQREERVRGVFIVGKHATDRKGHQIFDLDMADPDTGKFYVLVALPDGSRVEMKTSYIVFESLGEGLKGDIIHQGMWLSQFTMAPRP